MIACEGDGDPSGVGAFHKEEALVQKKRFLSLIHLTCFDSLETAQGLGGPPGTMHLVACPPNCRQVKSSCCMQQQRSRESHSPQLCRRRTERGLYLHWKLRSRPNSLFPPSLMQKTECTQQVCRAAIHSGTITQEGGEFLVVVGHRQHHFLALESHGIHSEESGAYPRSCE